MHGNVYMPLDIKEGGDDSSEKFISISFLSNGEFVK